MLNEVAGVRISDAARCRVREAAASLGYRIGPRGGGKLRVLGFLADELATSPFAAISVDSARDAALEANAVLMIASTRGDPWVEATILDQWVAQGVAGIIYARIFTRRVTAPPQLYAVRSVLLNCHDAKASLPTVLPAEQQGGLAATRRLVAAGHRRIGMIGGEPWMEASLQRASGYRRALREAGLPIDPALYRVGNWTQPSGYANAAAMLRLPSPPTAIFCGNDPMAQGCYDAAKELGRVIPRDLSVIGYDNRPMSRSMDPPLTTLHLPHTEMGRWASNRLLLPEPPPGVTIRLPCVLIERASVTPPA